MTVTQGMEQLSELTQAEKKYRAEGLLLAEERLACQVKIKESVTLRVPDEFKLPHVDYSS